MTDSQSTGEDTGWTSAVGVVLVLTLLLSVALVSAGGWNWFKAFIENAAPAWIQAIGSVAAIVAASAIARHQVQAARRLELRKQAYAEVQKLKIVLALMVRAHGLSKDITKAFQTHHFDDFDQVSPELMLDTHQALMALPVFEIPEGLLALDVLTIGRALGAMREHWGEIREAASQEAADLADRIARLDTLAAEIGEISLAAVKECKRHIADRERSFGSMDG